VVESAQGWSDIVLLSHLEVFTEVLVSAPPVSVDHTETLASSDLMEVRVADVVLDSVDWESAVAMSSTVRLVGLTDSVSPMVDHLFLLILDHHPDDEGLVKVEDQKAVHESNTVLGMEWVNLPVGISDWVLEEASDVFEGSPLLCIVSWLFHCVYKLAEITVGGLHQSSIINQEVSFLFGLDGAFTYLLTMSARSLMFGTPYMKPSIPVSLCRKLLLGLSRSYRYSVITDYSK